MRQFFVLNGTASNRNALCGESNDNSKADLITSCSMRFSYSRKNFIVSLNLEDFIANFCC